MTDKQRRCKICRCENVQEVNKMLIDGEKLQTIAGKFGFHVSSLSRHKQHIPDKLRAIATFNELQEGASLLHKIEALLQRAEGLLDQAEDSGDMRTAISAVREVRAVLELFGKASGELAPERVLIQVEPVISSIVMVLKQEIRDSETLQRISDRIATVDINS